MKALKVLMIFMVSCGNDFEGTTFSFREFEKIHIGGSSTFIVKLKNKDLLDLSKEYSLFCLIEEQNKKYVIRGYAFPTNRIVPFKNENLYQVEVSFIEEHETTSDFLEEEQIIEILNANPNCIECKILQHIYPFTYYSKPFCIPRDSILKEL